MHIDGQSYPLAETGQRSAMIATLYEVFQDNAGGFMVTADLASAFAAALADMERAAHRLDQIKIEHDEMEAVDPDLDLIGHAKSGEIGTCSLCRDIIIKRPQAQLATAISKTNVISFPIVPRPMISRNDCQDDGGDAA